MSEPTKIPRDRFNVGTKVCKPVGYEFDGIVRSSFLNGAGELRYVVESDAVPGLLHIFRHEHLAARSSGRGGRLIEDKP